METVIHLVLMAMAIGAGKSKKHVAPRIKSWRNMLFYMNNEIININALTAPPALTAVG